MTELVQLLKAVDSGKPLNRRQLRLAVRHRGLVRMWSPGGYDEETQHVVHEAVIDDWYALVERGAARIELTPRGRAVLKITCKLSPSPATTK